MYAALFWVRFVLAALDVGSDVAVCFSNNLQSELWPVLALSFIAAMSATHAYVSFGTDLRLRYAFAGRQNVLLTVMEIMEGYFTMVIMRTYTTHGKTSVPAQLAVWSSVVTITASLAVLMNAAVKATDMNSLLIIQRCILWTCLGLSLVGVTLGTSRFAVMIINADGTQDSDPDVAMVTTVFMAVFVLVVLYGYSSWNLKHMSPLQVLRGLRHITESDPTLPDEYVDMPGLPTA